MNYNWNWAVLVTEPYLSWLVHGLQMTLIIAVVASIVALLLGSIVGIMRTTDSRVLRMIGATYVELFRNIPLLLQLFLWFFVLPELLPAQWGQYLKRGMPHPEVVTAIVCLSFYQSARIAETLRATIQSISRGQRAAGLAIGMSVPQVYRYVLLPNAYRLALPEFASIFLASVKDSSLALTIGVLELTAQSRQIEVYTFQGFEAFIAATLLYQVVTLIVIALTQYLERRTRIPGTIGLGGR